MSPIAFSFAIALAFCSRHLLVALERNRVAEVRFPRRSFRLRYPARTLRNKVTEAWEGREAQIDEATKAAYRDGVDRGDLDYLPIWAGEALDLITAHDSASALVGRIAGEAELAISTAGGHRD